MSRQGGSRHGGSSRHGVSSAGLGGGGFGNAIPGALFWGEEGANWAELGAVGSGGGGGVSPSNRRRGESAGARRRRRTNPGDLIAKLVECDYAPQRAKRAARPGAWLGDNSGVMYSAVHRMRCVYASSSTGESMDLVYLTAFSGASFDVHAATSGQARDLADEAEAEAEASVSGGGAAKKRQSMATMGGGGELGVRFEIYHPATSTTCHVSFGEAEACLLVGDSMDWYRPSDTLTRDPYMQTYWEKQTATLIGRVSLRRITPPKVEPDEREDADEFALAVDGEQKHEQERKTAAFVDLSPQSKLPPLVTAEVERTVFSCKRRIPPYAPQTSHGLPTTWVIVVRCDRGGRGGGGGAGTTTNGDLLSQAWREPLGLSAVAFDTSTGLAVHLDISTEEVASVLKDDHGQDIDPLQYCREGRRNELCDLFVTALRIARLVPPPLYDESGRSVEGSDARAGKEEIFGASWKLLLSRQTLPRAMAANIQPAHESVSDSSDEEQDAEDDLKAEHAGTRRLMADGEDAAVEIQRIFRGLSSRQDGPSRRLSAALREEAAQLMHMREEAAAKVIQHAERRMVAQKRAMVICNERRTLLEVEKRQAVAIVCMQRVWRGARDRHEIKRWMLPPLGSPPALVHDGFPVLRCQMGRRIDGTLVHLRVTIGRAVVVQRGLKKGANGGGVDGGVDGGGDGYFVISDPNNIRGLCLLVEGFDPCSRREVRMTMQGKDLLAFAQSHSDLIAPITVTAASLGPFPGYSNAGSGIGRAGGRVAWGVEQNGTQDDGGGEKKAEEEEEEEEDESETPVSLGDIFKQVKQRWWRSSGVDVLRLRADEKNQWRIARSSSGWPTGPTTAGTALRALQRECWLAAHCAIASSVDNGLATAPATHLYGSNKLCSVCGRGRDVVHCDTCGDTVHTWCVPAIVDSDKDGREDQGTNSADSMLTDKAGLVRWRCGGCVRGETTAGGGIGSESTNGEITEEAKAGGASGETKSNSRGGGIGAGLLRMFQTMVDASGKGSEMQKALTVLFATLDMNKDGFVHKGEVLGALRDPDESTVAVIRSVPALAGLLKPTHYAEALEAMDTNQDGAVDVGELLSFCKEGRHRPIDSATTNATNASGVATNSRVWAKDAIVAMLRSPPLHVIKPLVDECPGLAPLLEAAADDDQSSSIHVDECEAALALFETEQEGAMNAGEWCAFAFVLLSSTTLRRIFGMIELGGVVPVDRLVHALCRDVKVRRAIASDAHLAVLLSLAPMDEPQSLRMCLPDSLTSALAEGDVAFPGFMMLCARLLRPPSLSKAGLATGHAGHESAVRVLESAFRVVAERQGGSGGEEGGGVCVEAVVDAMRDSDEVRRLLRSNRYLRPLLVVQSYPYMFRVIHSAQSGGGSGGGGEGGGGEGGHTITMPAFVDFCLATAASLDGAERSLRCAFDILDADHGRGAISAGDFMTRMHTDAGLQAAMCVSEALHPLMKPMSYAMLFKAMDTDGSGYVNYDEFKHFCSITITTLDYKIHTSDPPCLIFFTVYGSGEGVV